MIPAADGPEDWQRSLKAFVDTHEAAIDQFVSYLAEKLCQVRIVEFTFNVPVTRDGHCPRYEQGGRAEAIGLPAGGARRRHLRARPGWARPAWKRWTR